MVAKPVYIRLSPAFDFLKNLVSIFFIFVYLLANTELCQLVKMPVLISHFKEHKKQNGKISFIGFLKMHYFNGDPRDADYDTDMQLPFKTASGGLLFHNPLSAPVPSIAVVLCVPVQEIRYDLIPHCTAWVSSVCCADIFQPPRFS